MKLIRSIPPLRKEIQKAKRKNYRIAFVPTMGALHAGHISLVHRARRLVGPEGLVVVSIFVNPTQFNQRSDLKHYPRQLRKDAEMCREASVDLIFAPSAPTMYGPHFSTWVDEEQLSLPLCGAARPGHFRGVCTVVLKLFQLVQPDIAIFGQKDAQQSLVIQRMVKDLNIPVRIVVAPIVREKDGLAMSSRNQRLSPTERQQAIRLYQALQQAKSAFRRGTRSAKVLKKLARKEIERSGKFRIDYVELIRPETLRSVTQASRGDLMAIAAFLGKVRLIDNIIFR